MNGRKFKEYIAFLKENFETLIEYREKTGNFDPAITKIRDELSDTDPFVVFHASMAASILLADKSFYH